MAGVPLKTIQALAGHKTIAITARYAHLAPNTLHAAVELISSLPGIQAGTKYPQKYPQPVDRNYRPKKQRLDLHP